MTETPDRAAASEWRSWGSVVFTGPEGEGHPSVFCGTQYIAQTIAELHNAALRDVTARAEAAEAAVARVEALCDAAGSPGCGYRANKLSGGFGPKVGVANLRAALSAAPSTTTPKEPK